MIDLENSLNARTLRRVLQVSISMSALCHFQKKRDELFARLVESNGSEEDPRVKRARSFDVERGPRVSNRTFPFARSCGRPCDAFGLTFKEIDPICLESRGVWELREVEEYRSRSGLAVLS